MSKFTVYDDNGNVWPPGFKCSLDDEEAKRASDKRMQAACDASTKARAEGRGWSQGTLHHMQKPLIPKASA